MTNQSMIVAVDPGFGNTKAYFDGNLKVIPSIVTRPKNLGQAGTGLKNALPITEVVFENYHFAIGSSAIEWGTPLDNMDYLSFISAEKQSLLYGALAGVLPTNHCAIDTLIVGLPVQLLKDEVQAEQILSGLRLLKGKHCFSVDRQFYEVNIDRVRVMPQPLGTYADWLLGENLRPRANATQSEVAIIDIGMNTVDFYAMQGGRPEPRFVDGAKSGVRRLFEILKVEGRDLSETDIAYRNGRLKPSDHALQNWLGEIIAQVEVIMPKLSRFSAVIPTGGGAVVLSDQLRYALIKGSARCTLNFQL